MALLLTLVGVSLSTLMLPMVLGQIDATQSTISRAQSLSAAEAGLDVALGHLRAASDSSGPNISLLPCGLFTGSVGAGGTGRYQVNIDYFLVDPTAKSSAWIAANRITCAAGSGPYRTPAYVLFRSDGTDKATGAFGTVNDRIISATYTVNTTNQNISGGLIHVVLQNDLCLDAGSSSPTPGTNVVMQPCDETSPQQTFEYNPNLNLVLVSSITVALPLGMCLDAGTPHAIGKLVQFQPCTVTTSPNQQWSINDASNFEGTSDGLTLDGYCFNVQIPDLVSSPVILGTGSNCHGSYDNKQTFSPSATVGAGAAGATSGQLVNFSEFGRCLDVTNTQVSSSFLIAWICKQAPDPTNVLWNQRWNLPAISPITNSGTGQIITTPPGGRYCLHSPASTAPGQYVIVTSCPIGSTPPHTTWTVFTDTGNYATSYRIQDDAGYCLAPTDPNAQPPDFFTSGQEVSKLVVDDCDGSTLQKWNAPPNLLKSLPLKNLTER